MGWFPCGFQEPTLMASSPSLPSPILCFGKLHSTGLFYFQPYSGLSPLLFTVSKHAPSGRMLCVYTLIYSQLGHTLLVAPESYFVLSRLCFCLSNPTGQGLRPGSPHFHLGLLQPSISCPPLSFCAPILCPTYRTSPSCLCSHCHSVLLVPPLPG